MSEPFLGEIRAVAFDFAPPGWASCDGSLLYIAQHSALFSLLGTTYGGNGTTTFALPDLRGRSPVGMGTGPGLSPIQRGEQGGLENASILQSNMPAHTHSASAVFTCATLPGLATSPAGNVPAITVLEDGRTEVPSYASPSLANANTAPASVKVDPTGGSAPLSIRNPYLGQNFIIATEGVFPARP